MKDRDAILAPGRSATHPDHPEWGTGQVQSNAACKITLNFPVQGKVVFNGAQVALIPVFDPS